MSKKKKKIKKKKKGRPKTGEGEMQNKLYLSAARQIVEDMPPAQRGQRIEELMAEGYEENEYFDVLVEQDTVLPYDFILLNLLVRKSNE